MFNSCIFLHTIFFIISCLITIFSLIIIFIIYYIHSNESYYVFVGLGVKRR
jgi:hypothetical protein